MISIYIYIWHLYIYDIYIYIYIYYIVYIILYYIKYVCNIYIILVIIYYIDYIHYILYRLQVNTIYYILHIMLYIYCISTTNPAIHTRIKSTGYTSLTIGGTTLDHNLFFRLSHGDLRCQVGRCDLAPLENTKLASVEWTYTSFFSQSTILKSIFPPLGHLFLSWVLFAFVIHVTKNLSQKPVPKSPSDSSPWEFPQRSQLFSIFWLLNLSIS